MQEHGGIAWTSFRPFISSSHGRHTKVISMALSMLVHAESPAVPKGRILGSNHSVSVCRHGLASCECAKLPRSEDSQLLPQLRVRPPAPVRASRPGHTIPAIKHAGGLPDSLGKGTICRVQRLQWYAAV